MNEDWNPQRRTTVGDPRTPAELAAAHAMRTEALNRQRAAEAAEAKAAEQRNWLERRRLAR